MSDEITGKEIIKCPFCDEINKADVSVCVNCGEEIPENRKVRVEIKDLGAEKKDAASDFGTLMFIGQLNSFIGWLLVAGSVIAIIIGLSDTDKIVVALTGAVAIPISLLVVASGQIISCFVSTERNTKETNGLLRKILDKMEDKPIQQEEGK